MPGTLPTGLGNDQQASQATAFMRQQPWYQDFLTSQGVQPGEGDQVKLNEQQRAQLMALALKNGIGLNHKYDMIDENGQIAEEHHKAKKIAIAAAIAGLALTGLGAAGIGPLAGALGGTATAGTIPTTMGLTGAEFGGAAATGAIPAALGGAAAAGTAASTIPTVMGLTGAEFGGAAATVAPEALAGGAAAAGAAVPAAVSGIEGGVPGALDSAALPGAYAAPTTADVSGVVAGNGINAAGTGGTLSTLQKASRLLGAGGEAVGAAGQAAGQNRLSTAELAMRAQQAANQTAQTNISGQNAFENALMNRAKEEQLQRSDALKNIYRQSYATNRTAGPFNQAGLTKYSPEYLAALGDLTKQGGSTIAKAPIYGMDTQPKLAPLPLQKPFDPKEFMDQYGQPGTLEQTSNWLSPTLTTLGKAYQIYRGVNG